MTRPGGRRYGAVMVTVAAATLAACAGGGGGAGVSDAEVLSEQESKVAAPPEGCEVDELGDERIVSLSGSPGAGSAQAITATTFRCAGSAVVAPADDPWAAAIAVPVALADAAPLLLADAAAPGAPVEAAAHLEPGEVVTVGFPTGSTDDGVTPVTAVAPDGGADGPSLPPETELGLAVVAHLDADAVLAVPIDDHLARAAAVGHLAEGQALVPVPSDPSLTAEVALRLPDGVGVEVLAADASRAATIAESMIGAGGEASAVEEPLWPEGQAGTAWLVDPDQAANAAVVGVVAAHRGDRVLPVDSTDLRNGRADTDRLRAADPQRLVLTGDLTGDADWQLRTVLEGEPLPTGGFRLFEDHRIVALYGHPGAAGLGGLGEQDLDASVERVRSIAAPYGADGQTVVPSFEIIASVASSEPGADGNYSSAASVESLRPWVDRAADEGFYVVLDLQPGRGDFLTQAKLYEELLLEPHVGLAIDPEWRLGPDQTHMRQIGSVGAAEVQAVADWLAALTRAHHLPEKLLVLHQFKLAMLPDRDTIVAPPELALVVHMDGHGSQQLKDGSYDAVTAGAEDRWLWGWKNFYERDFPTADAARVLALDPLPVFVSYQ